MSAGQLRERQVFACPAGEKLFSSLNLAREKFKVKLAFKYEGVKA
jgi:hypothetical protein